MKVLLAFLWKYLLGVLLCLTPFTAIVVLGWTGRAMRRSAAKTWYRQSAGNTAAGFADAMMAAPETAHLAKWPNWIVGQPAGSNETLGGSESRTRRFLRRCFGSLWENAALGLQMALNCWVITIPACLLWLLGWWAGWENSFNKGYEQAWVGPATAFTGVAIFIAAMFHLPLAQARQAVTGRWRAFYDFRLMHSLRKLGRMSALWLVVLYLLAGILITGAKIAPLGIGNYLAGLETPLSVEQADQVQLLWALAAAALVFSLFVALRLAAARNYARGVTSGLAKGKLDISALVGDERMLIERFDLANAVTSAPRNIVVRSVAASSVGLGAALVTVLVVAGWAAFSFQIFFAQFLNHSWVAWLNLSLIQLPWIK